MEMEFLDKNDHLSPNANKHYILVDELGRVIDGWSDGPKPEKNTNDAICINEQGGYQFKLFSDGEENPNLYTLDGCSLYKFKEGMVISRTKDEISEDRMNFPKLSKTLLEKLDENLEFLADIMEGLTELINR